MDGLHVAIIMDGNRRHASEQGKPKILGHKHGSQKFEEVVEWCKEAGIRMLTLYTFSTKNFKRGETEKMAMFTLFREYFSKFKKDTEGKWKDLKLCFLGRLHLFPQDIQDMATELERSTKEKPGLQINFCFGYGGREELVDAANKAIQKGEEVNEETFAQHLYFSEAPDLVIRTGGQVRTSDFLPWQAAYAEWFFTDTYWPALTKEEFSSILSQFSERQRNFGT